MKLRWKFNREIDLKPKLNLIYYSKCKSNVKWWKIKMKIHNLTQSCARNDPINRRIHGFSFCDFEDEDDIQDVISPYSLNQILISSTHRTQKRVNKLKNSKDSQIVVSRQFDLLENPRVIFHREEHSNLFRALDVIVGCNGSSRSTTEMTRLLMNWRN